MKFRTWFRTWKWAAFLLVTWLEPALSRESRQELLQSCAQQAKDQSKSGDAYAEFMRSCLKKPDDAKPLAFASSAPQKVAPGQTIQPTLVEPSQTARKVKPGG